MYMQQFFTQFLAIFVKKSTFEKNMTLTILCPVVCVSGVMNKAGMCDKSIKCVMSQPYAVQHR